MRIILNLTILIFLKKKCFVTRRRKVSVEIAAAVAADADADADAEVDNFVVVHRNAVEALDNFAVAHHIAVVAGQILAERLADS